MASLTGQTIASTYDALLKISDNGPINGTLKQITDGLGNNTPLYLSGNTVSIDGSFKLTGRLFDKNNESGVAGQFLVSSGDGVDWQNISESGLITGTGTASFLSKFTAGGVIADSIVSESASGIGIGITATQKLHVLGNGLFTGTLNSSNLSGNNTGDETKVSIETKLGAATSSNDGYLTSTNWSTFNAKQPALNGLGFVKIDGTTISYDNSTYALASRNIATTSPLSGGGNLSANRSLSIAKSDSLTDGYLSADDFVNFNSKVPSARTITINGETFDLSANRTYAVNVGVTSFNTRVGAVSLSSLDVTNALGYTPAIDSRIMTINGVGYNLAADRTWSVGTVTSVGTSAPLTGGTITGSGTIGISQSNTTTDGYLSSTDWNTFNNKQANLGYTPENLANKGINNGYASLGGDGKVPSTQLPSYVDDVVEVANFAALPATGETGKIYITLDTNFVYRWSGTVYVKISEPNAVWGSITGTLANQVDLQNALNAKIAGTIAIGQVAFGSGVNTVAGDNGLYWNNIDKRLGVGTNNPLYKLDVNGTARITSTLTTDVDAVVNGVNIGRGGGSFTLNTRIGQNALRDNTTGTVNSAFGRDSLVLNTTGANNASFGTYSLSANTIGASNAGFGAQSLAFNTSGNNNSGLGFNSIYSNTTGSANTAVGSNSLFGNTTGGNNIAFGTNAGRFIADGTTANTITGTSIYLGFNTKALANNQTNQTVIGYDAVGLGSNTTVLGNSSTVTTGIYGRLLLGSTTDNTVDRLQVTGSVNVTQGLNLATLGGNTSIGYTTNPSLYKLDVNGTGRFSGLITGQNGIYQSNASASIASNKFETYNAGSTQMQFIFPASGSVAFNNGSDRLAITSNGNVGIGTTTPGEKLTVNGYIGLQNAGTQNWHFGTDSSNNLSFIRSGIAEALRITQGGNVLIGTTSDNDAKLQVNGNIVIGTAATNAISGEGVVINSNENGVRLVTSQSTNTYETLSMYSTGAGAYRFYVGWGGTIYATSTSITAISDQRLKENVRPLANSLSIINNLNPVMFDWKEGKGLDKKNDIGFIAQEFEKVFPNSVSDSLAGDDGISYKALNHSELIPTLVKAIQEQQAQIEELKQLIQNK